MTRHPTARRVHRQAPSDEDTFVAGVLETSVWARTHARTLIIGGIVVVAVILGFLLYRGNQSARNTQAAAQLMELRQTVASGNVQLAARDGQAFVASYGNTEAGREGRLLVGQLLLQSDQPAEAAEAVEPLAGDLDEPLGFNAALLLGAAYEAADRTDDAIRTYASIGSDAEYDYQRVAGLEEAARLHADAGNHAAAIAAFEQILELLEAEAPERGIYEMRIAELEAAQNAPAAATPAQGAPAAAPVQDQDGTQE